MYITDVWTGITPLENRLVTLGTLDGMHATQQSNSTPKSLAWNYTHSCAQGGAFSVPCCNLYSREKWKPPKYFSVEEEINCDYSYNMEGKRASFYGNG